ncbi:hypothetical protein OHC33_000147 [Knufia fluminis]|uniref:AB hydrolase-1 domain-containing protein n=1 Tax=Knufia fluminis TaxID=191047 RepID=A0AAN8EXD5_9EURO|nr:hypothetical protein OHC33_000147 [Knufia fluminis]
MSSKPTLILIPGAWHTASIWDKVTSILSDQQYKCIPIKLPSTTPTPSTSFLDNITVVRNAIKAEIAQGRNVVVIGHSYGGPVGSSAIKGLTRPKHSPSQPQHQGHNPTTSPTNAQGHVIGLALLATGYTKTGLSVLASMGGTPPPFWHINLESNNIEITAPLRELFYRDLPLDEGNDWVCKLEKQATKAFLEGGKHVYAGWMDVPVWNLITTEDNALPYEVQRSYVETARAQGGDVTVREVDSGDFPMLSRVDETVEFILDAVRAFVGERAMS